MDLYASQRQLPEIVCENRDPDTGEYRRFTKHQLKQRLPSNLDCLEKHFLPEFMSYRSLDQYYTFLTEFFHPHYRIRIPYPSIENFFLSLQLGKLTEAASILLLLYKRTPEINKWNPAVYFPGIDKIIDPEGGRIASELRRIESQPLNRWEINDMQTEYIKQTINENISKLNKELDRRIMHSQETCQHLLGHFA